MKIALRLEPYDDITFNRVMVHGLLWQLVPCGPLYRPDEVIMKSVKTGHTKWWNRDYVFRLIARIDPF